MKERGKAGNSLSQDYKGWFEFGMQITPQVMSLPLKL